MQKYFLITLFFVLFLNIINSKELLIQSNTSIKQVKFDLDQDEPLIFTEKYQNLNGKITETFSINEEFVDKGEFRKKVAWAEMEEKRIKKEKEEREMLERLKKEQEERERKELEEKMFVKEAKIEGMKKLVKLELQKVEGYFAKLDKYRLEDFFMFEENTFAHQDILDEARIGLIAQARGIIIKSIDELKIDELKSILEKLEALPDKIERFFRQSVRFAINQCNETKRLKELLSLIS